MSSPKTLIYPFSIETPYFESYAWAVELASRINAKLLLFTTTASVASNQLVYHSLLAAHGYYLEHYQSTPHLERPSVREPLISHGILEEELVLHLRANPADIVILDSAFSIKYASKLQHIVKESAGVIVLPQDNQEKSYLAVDRFYDHLRRARLYKLPNNFFSSLATDRNAFNYLRNFFQKKST